MTHVTELERDTARREKKEPSKRWRNKWRAMGGGVKGCGGSCKGAARGEIFETPCCHDHESWPAFISKEVAEQRAADDRDFDTERFGICDEYLGAFPLEAE